MTQDTQTEPKTPQIERIKKMLTGKIIEISPRCAPQCKITVSLEPASLTVNGGGAYEGDKGENRLMGMLIAVAHMQGIAYQSSMQSITFKSETDMARVVEKVLAIEPDSQGRAPAALSAARNGSANGRTGRGIIHPL